MKQKLFLLFALLSMSLIFSCSKSDNASSGPSSISFDPIPGKVYTNTSVTITGNNFGTDTSKIDLRLDSKKMVITAISDKSLTFFIPQNFIPWGQKDCTLEIFRGDIMTMQRQVMVYYSEPAHGWGYGGPLPQNTAFKQLIFPTDSIGYVLADRSIYRTTDGGTTWVADANNGKFTYGYAIASSDGLNTWMDYDYQVAVSDNGTKWTLGAEGRSFDRTISGLYTAGPANGLVATQAGRLFDVNGSFASATIKYQSAQYTTGNFALWGKVSALDKNNLIIAGFANNRMILEKAGVFSEVDISSVSPPVKDVQMVDANTAYMVDANNALIKYDGNNWTKLSQPANLVYFTNATTGYIVYDKKILKTTDGGATWNVEFTVNDDEFVTSICARNGKVWAIGISTKQQGFTVKYKP